MESLHTQGIDMPRLGFGTWRLKGKECQEAVERALALGYRHLDTAEMYGNEEDVGAAIAAAGVPRDQLHVTTKVWNDHLEPDALRRAFDTSLSKLRLDHVDLYHVHWPKPDLDLPSVMSSMMRLREAGLTRAIGVCNFNLPLVRQAIEDLGAPIASVQIEYHPFLGQSPMLAYLRGKKVPLTAYAPLAQGRAASDPLLIAIGAKHGVTAGQIALAWLLDQDGVIVIPKAQSEANQKGNLAALDIELDDEDRQAIAALPKSQRYVNPAFAPAWDAPLR